MNEYSYKQKVESLPKLNLTSLTTQYLSFYTNRSKNKSNSSNYNTHRIPTSNATTLIFSSRINSNDQDKIHPQTAKNLKNETSRKHKKKKIKSSIIYLTEIDKKQTDDDYFAMSQIKRIDNAIKKRINKDIIWKEKTENKYDIFTSKNRTDINNVKTRVRQNLSGVNFNLRKEVNKNNYFPVEHIETIQDAKKIIRKIKNNIVQDRKVVKKYKHFNIIDLHTFREQNRDICLRNILINIIKTESNKLKKKETIVGKALKEANDDFNKDKDNFEILTKNEISNFRMKEIKLDEAIKQNRVLIEEIKKRGSELRGTKDEAKKYIKDIILYIKYENFIKKIIAKEKDDNSNFTERKIPRFINIKNDKEFEIIIKNIIKEYYTNSYDNKLILTKDITPEMVNNLFNSMESNIINALEMRDLMIKEISDDKKKYENILDDLKLKVEQNKKELDIIMQERNLVYNLFTPNKDMKEIIEENEANIMILYKELSKYIKDKTFIKTENLSLNTLRLLHILEDKLINVLDKLNEITEKNENTPLFQECIEKLKLENKREKQNSKKSLANKLIEEKHKKLQQRMLRFKVRGPIRFPPPWVINKSKKKKKITRDEKAENDEILFYE